VNLLFFNENLIPPSNIYYLFSEHGALLVQTVRENLNAKKGLLEVEHSPIFLRKML